MLDLTGGTTRRYKGRTPTVSEQKPPAVNSTPKRITLTKESSWDGLKAIVHDNDSLVIENARLAVENTRLVVESAKLAHDLDEAIRAVARKQKSDAEQIQYDLAVQQGEIASPSDEPQNHSRR